jgi:hypothetical protein
MTIRRKITALLAALTAAAGLAAAAAAVAGPAGAAARPHSVRVEYVLNGDPAMTMLESTQGTSRTFRIPLGGTVYRLACSRETPEVFFCGVRPVAPRGR